MSDFMLENTEIQFNRYGLASTLDWIRKMFNDDTISIQTKIALIEYAERLHYGRAERLIQERELDRKRRTVRHWLSKLFC